MTRRLLVVSNSPTPYNDALYAELARRPGIDLHVAYGAELEPHRSWELQAEKGYAYRILPGWSLGGSAHVNPGLWAHVRRLRPEIAILTGSYTMPTIHLAAAALHGMGAPWLYWGEELSHGPAAPPLLAVRALLRRILLRARGVLAIGTRAVESYVRAGVPRPRIADFRYYADTAHFQLPAGEGDRARAEVRAGAGLGGGTPLFLYCGQLVARKRVDTLLRALARLRAHPAAPAALVAGDGPERTALEALARELGIAGRVHFAGFVQPRELPRVFAAADAFVLPSRQEGWGVVVPEAMAAGLPVLASHAVNAAADLVRDGESGGRFAVGDDAALAGWMELVCSPERRHAMSAAARAAIQDEAPGPASRRLVTLLDAALEDGPLNGL